MSAANQRGHLRRIVVALVAMSVPIGTMLIGATSAFATVVPSVAAVSPMTNPNESPKISFDVTGNAAIKINGPLGDARHASLWSNTGQLSTSARGSGDLIVSGYSSSCNGGTAIVQIAADGKNLGTVDLTATNSIGSYALPAGLPVANHAITVSLTNDLYTASCDRNAFVVAVAMSSGLSGFAHPGVLVDRAQLDINKAKAGSGPGPITDQYIRLYSQKGLGGQLLVGVDYQPHPVAVVKCKSGGSATPQDNVAGGCNVHQDDSLAAYLNALTYYYTGITAYADTAVRIMNAWSSTLTGIAMDTSTYTNGLLQAAWGTANWTRAAELIRYTSSGWKDADIQRFDNMLVNSYLPLVKKDWSGGGANWNMSTIEAEAGIGVVTDNRAVFNEAISRWNTQLPATVYMKSDTNPYAKLSGSPVPPANSMYATTNTTPAAMATYWHNPTSYQDGLEAETCRDLSHADMGLEGMVDTAETARLQGVDLYGPNKARILAGFELNAKVTNQFLATGSAPGICQGAIVDGGAFYKTGYEIAYNEFAHRLGVAMPNVKTLLNTTARASSYRSYLFDAMQELTHGYLG